MSYSVSTIIVVWHLHLYCYRYCYHDRYGLQAKQSVFPEIGTTTRRPNMDPPRDLIVATTKLPFGPAAPGGLVVTHHAKFPQPYSRLDSELEAVFKLASTSQYAEVGRWVGGGSVVDARSHFMKEHAYFCRRYLTHVCVLVILVTAFMTRWSACWLRGTPTTR